MYVCEVDKRIEISQERLINRLTAIIIRTWTTGNTTSKFFIIEIIKIIPFFWRK